MEQNLNQYKIFYEVAKCGNISNAAENLYISQPAVSKAVSNLENSLSHTLFVRSKRGVKLTDEGKTLYESLAIAFENIDRAEKKLKRMEELGIGQIRLGASTSLCKHILLPYLQDYIELNPHVKISIDCKPTFETLQQLKADKIDLGLICETKLEKGYHFMPICTIHDTFVATKTYLDNLVLRESHEESYNLAYDDTNDHINDKTNDGIVDNNRSNDNLVDNINKEDNIIANNVPVNMTGLIMFSQQSNRKKSRIKLSEKEILEKCNLMLLDKGNISRIYIDNYMKEHNINPSQILEINNMDLLIDFAAIGMGVAGVVKEFITDYIESKQVVEIPIDHKIEPRTVGFVYNENSISTSTDRFLNYIKNLR